MRLDVWRDALVALAADAGRPGDRGAFADLRFPLRADLRQVVDPIEGRARSVRAVHHRDREVRAAVTPGLSAATAASFHFLILPK